MVLYYVVYCFGVVVVVVMVFYVKGFVDVDLYMVDVCCVLDWFE